MTKLMDKLGRFVSWFNARSAAMNQVATLSELMLLGSYRPNRHDVRATKRLGKQRCDMWRHSRSGYRARKMMRDAGEIIRGN